MESDDITKKILLLKEEIKKKYNKSEDDALKIANELVNYTISKAISDSSNLSFKEFFKKYLPSILVFEANDFTVSEIETIIKETPLSARDKQIATLRYINLKSEDEIAYELQIDKKTVHTNIKKISDMLKITCLKLYK